MTTETLEHARDRLRPYVERSNAFSGWRPVAATQRLGGSRPWDYMLRARALVAGAPSVVDLGTGGGERFEEICAGYPGRAVATEEWTVNIPVAATRLRPVGIPVVACSTSALPFADESFDLVLDRHTALEPSEVARVLRPAGTVLTEQVWKIWTELDQFFPRRHDWGDHFHSYQTGFVASGLELLDVQEDIAKTAFADLGDLVYMLCILAPWDIPDFDPLGGDLEALVNLEQQCTTADGLVLSDGRYVIEARKPGR